jgi:hypothetical protein
MARRRRCSETAGSYESEPVLAFIEMYTERETWQNGGKPAVSINGIRLADGHRQRLNRWAAAERVSLDRVDKFLMHYDLMVSELEHWAHENGHGDIYAEGQPCYRYRKTSDSAAKLAA